MRPNSGRNIKIHDRSGGGGGGAAAAAVVENMMIEFYRTEL
jgi:hypothetical protein